MSAHQAFGWRDRAIALASLGAAALSRAAFTTADVIGEQPLKPLEMQVLVSLALQDSLAGDPPRRTGVAWLSRALSLERWVIEDTVDSLERANLVRRFAETPRGDELEPELAATSDEDVMAGELPVAVTERGLHTVEGWLNRTRRHFGSWPPEQPDVDDAVG